MEVVEADFLGLDLLELELVVRTSAIDLPNVSLHKLHLHLAAIYKDTEVTQVGQHTSGFQVGFHSYRKLRGLQPSARGEYFFSMGLRYTFRNNVLILEVGCQ